MSDRPPIVRLQAADQNVISGIRMDGCVSIGGGELLDASAKNSSTISDITFRDHVHLGGDSDLRAQLTALMAKLEEIALVSVGAARDLATAKEAEVALDAGDAARGFQILRKLGMTAYGMATNIGAGLIVEFLKGRLPGAT